jgi:hypothetical protein
VAGFTSEFIMGYSSRARERALTKKGMRVKEGKSALSSYLSWRSLVTSMSSLTLKVGTERD